MSSFFKESLLDKYTLNKEKFETVIGLGSSKAEVRRMFCIPALKYNGEDTNGLDVLEYCGNEAGRKHIDFLLDKWCNEVYSMPYSTVYGLIQDMTLKTFEDAMLELGIRGNPSAISIMNEVIRKKENNSVCEVRFVNNLPLETEEDKKDDES